MKRLGLGWCVCLIVLAAPAAALAQTDEIQVYTGAIANVHQFNLTLHNNYTPSGVTDPAFPGAVTANKSWNGVPEWALGVTRWFEAGLYLPLYSHDQTMGWGYNGFKLRALFVSPNADDRPFFYGANFEFSINAKRWNTSHFTSEVRPIVGWHLGRLDLVFNPILDTAYDGFGNLDFAPSVRIAWNPTKKAAIAVEEYADYGPIKGFNSWNEQSHQIYGVFDYGFNELDLEAGVGFGLTPASDNLTIKLILSHNFNKGKGK